MLSKTTYPDPIGKSSYSGKNLIGLILLVGSILFLFLPGQITYAQSTILKLPTTDNTSSFDVTKSDDFTLFKLFGDGGFYSRGTNVGEIPIEGGGARLMWYPKKAAFRVGQTNFTGWDDQYIGNWSVAMGSNTFASGENSTAMGTFTSATGIGSTSFGGVTIASGDFSTTLNFYTTASGHYSIAMGSNTTASGETSTAIGYWTTASGYTSTAMGSWTTASGYTSTAMGSWTTASGNFSTSMGFQTTANGNYSTAMGTETTASGNSSTAMGTETIASGHFSTAMGWLTEASGFLSTTMGTHVSTNNHAGSFIIGDNSTSSFTNSSSPHQMTMRFRYGYRLFTNSSATVGAMLDGGANSWTTISDSTKKEQFVYADGEQFLNSLSELRLGSWNYKTQDAKEYRHYGPMAQEIFNYFGKDKYGTIGNDTTLATADMDGIIMIILQALEKRTVELQKAAEKISQLEKLISTQETKLSLHYDEIEDFKEEFREMKSVVFTLLKEKENSESLVRSK